MAVTRNQAFREARRRGADEARLRQREAVDSGDTEGSNNPPVIVELDPKIAAFLVENCNSNINLGLALLENARGKPEAEKLVDLIENFKQARMAIWRAQS